MAQIAPSLGYTLLLTNIAFLPLTLFFYLSVCVQRFKARGDKLVCLHLAAKQIHGNGLRIAITNT